MARSTVDWDDDDDDFGGDDQPTRTEVPDLRKAYNALKRQNKELTEQLTLAQKGIRERSVKDVLTAKGLNAKIAAFIPESVTTEEDVQAWVDQYGDVFGTPTPEPPANEGQENPDLTALGQIADSQQSGAPFTGDAAQMASLIANARTPEELNKVLFGNVAGPQAI